MKNWKEIRDEAMKRSSSISEEKIKENRERLENFRAICAFEDIVPDEDMKLDDELLTQGKMSYEEYDEYLRIKIKQKYQS